jgi:tetratricopeptide (TPR) repeat protein
MGVVYLCYDQQAAEPIAIKTYLDGLTGDPGRSDTDFVQLFESEALLWIRLGRHPHIVQARYVLRLGGKPHIFLEYVPGPTGGESTVRRLLRDGPVDAITALSLAIQTCVGMEHATHVFPGFVHRDLKPENLLLTPEHILKITDFGLTKVFADFGGDVGVVAGTPPYMAPEQCLGLPSLDTRADIYSLGVILYELLTGRRPFVATDVTGYLRAHLIDVPVPPRQAVPEIPDAVDRLVLRCLAKSPERRYPSFAALRVDLEACYTTLAGYAPILPRADEATDENAAALAGVEMARAISLVTLGRYDEAMTFFDLAVEHDPSLGRAWYFRGLALNGLGRFEDALDCLDRVVRLDPRDVGAWVEKGRSLTRAGRREEALGCFDRAIAINPWHAPALYEKGVCLLFLGHYDAAAACIGEVALLQPGPAVDAARYACQAGRERQPARGEPSWDGRQGWSDPRSRDGGAIVDGAAPASSQRPLTTPPPSLAPPLAIPPPPTRPPGPTNWLSDAASDGTDDDLDSRT